jgi:hypothetical protein
VRAESDFGVVLPKGDPAIKPVTKGEALGGLQRTSVEYVDLLFWLCVLRYHPEIKALWWVEIKGSRCRCVECQLPD